MIDASHLFKKLALEEHQQFIDIVKSKGAQKSKVLKNLSRKL